MIAPTSSYGCGDYNCIGCYGDEEWQNRNEEENATTHTTETCQERGCTQTALYAHYPLYRLEGDPFTLWCHEHKCPNCEGIDPEGCVSP